MILADLVKQPSKETPHIFLALYLACEIFFHGQNLAKTIKIVAKYYPDLANCDLADLPVHGNP